MRSDYRVDTVYNGTHSGRQRASNSDARRRQDRARFGYHSKAVLGAIMMLERRHGFRARVFYSSAIKGFAATITPAVAAKLSADPLVLSIEADDPISLPPLQTVQTTGTQIVDWGIPKIGADHDSCRAWTG